MHDYRLHMLYKFPKEIHNLQNNADGYKGWIMMDNITWDGSDPQLERLLIYSLSNSTGTDASICSHPLQVHNITDSYKMLLETAQLQDFTQDTCRNDYRTITGDTDYVQIAVAWIAKQRPIF